jgi:hypothetical protein
VAAIWVDAAAGRPGGYWNDRSTAVYLLALSAGSGVLALRRETRRLAAAGGLLLVGFHVFTPLVYVPDRLGELREGAWLVSSDVRHVGEFGAGAWLGLGGGALLVAGTYAVTRSPASGSAPVRRHESHSRA